MFQSSVASDDGDATAARTGPALNPDDQQRDAARHFGARGGRPGVAANDRRDLAQASNRRVPGADPRRIDHPAAVKAYFFVNLGRLLR